MADCEALNSRNPQFPLLTKENVHELLVSTFDRSSGTSVTVECVDGYELVGESNFVCRNGRWSYGSKPYCRLAGTGDSDKTNSSDILLISVIVVVVVVVLILAIMIFVVCFRRSCKRKLKEERRVREMRTIQHVQSAPPPHMMSTAAMYPYVEEAPGMIPYDQETSFSGTSREPDKPYNPYQAHQDYYRGSLPYTANWISNDEYGSRIAPYGSNNYLWQSSYGGNYPY